MEANFRITCSVYKKTRSNRECINEPVSITLLMEMTPTNVCDNAPRLQVQQELSYLWPGFIAAVIEIWSNLVIDTVHMVSLELAGSLLHHVCPGYLMQRPHSIMPGRKNTFPCSLTEKKSIK